MLIWLNKLLGRVEERVVQTAPTKRRGIRQARWKRELVCVNAQSARRQSGKSNLWALATVIAIGLFISIMAPMMIMMGLLSFLAVKFFQLPGIKGAFKVLFGVYCTVNGTIEDIYKIGGGGFNLIKKATSAAGSAIKGVASVAGKGLKIIPGIGGTLSGMVSIGGKVFSSPFSAVSKATDLAGGGLKLARSLSEFVCKLNDFAKDLESRGYKDAFGKALNCANWDASRYGPLNSPANSTKDGTPKYCVEGDIGGDKSNFFIPTWLLQIYKNAGEQYNVPWEMLAAVNLNDTNLGLSDWATPVAEMNNRVGWIPFTRGEWYGDNNAKAYAINDSGGTAPNFFGSPYTSKQSFEAKKSYITIKDAKGKLIKQPVPAKTCPIPLDTKGAPWQYTAGTSTADDDATASDAGLSDYKGGKLTAKQIGQLMIQVGFPPEEIAPGIAIALAESGGDPKANSGNPSAPQGMWQFLGHPDLKNVQHDPAGSTKAVLEKFYKPDVKGGSKGWKQWQTFIGPKSANYDHRMLEFIDEAKKAAKELGVSDDAINVPQSTWGTHDNYGKGGGIGLDANSAKNRQLSIDALKPVLRKYLNDRDGNGGFRIQTKAGATVAEVDAGSGSGRSTLTGDAQGYKVTLYIDSSVNATAQRSALNFIVRQLNTALNPGGTGSSGNVSSVAGTTYSDNVDAGGGYKLLPSQATMADIVARRTGVDINVIRAQIINEQGDSRSSAAQGRERAKNYNWLNIGWTDSGRTGFSYDDVWSDPVKAGNATADFMQGIGKVHGAPSIVNAYKQAKGKSAEEATRLIGLSGWASSQYKTAGGGPGSSLMAIYNKLKKIDQPTGAAASGSDSGTVEVSFDTDAQYDPCDPVDGIYGLAQWLSKSGAHGQVWKEAYPSAEELAKVAQQKGNSGNADADGSTATGAADDSIEGKNKKELVKWIMSKADPKGAALKAGTNLALQGGAGSYDDIKSDRADGRLIGLLAYLIAKDWGIQYSVMSTGHKPGTNHGKYQAIDITAIRQPGTTKWINNLDAQWGGTANWEISAAGRAFTKDVNEAPKAISSNEKFVGPNPGSTAGISNQTLPSGVTPWVALVDHDNHFHIGFDDPHASEVPSFKVGDMQVGGAAGTSDAQTTSSLVPTCFADKAKAFPSLDNMLQANSGELALRLNTCITPAETPSAEVCDSTSNSQAEQNLADELASEAAAAAQTFKVPNRKLLQGVLQVQTRSGCVMERTRASAGWAGMSQAQWNKYGTNVGWKKQQFSDKFSSADSLFSTARLLSAVAKASDRGAWESGNVAVYKTALTEFFAGNSDADEVESKVRRVLSYANASSNDANRIVYSDNGRALQLRNYRIDPSVVVGGQTPCKSETVYAVCIAKIYKVIVQEYNRPPDSGEESGGVLGGGCGEKSGDTIKVSDLPNIKDKPSKVTGTRELLENKQRDKINVTAKNSWGRKDAIEATLAVTKAFQECYPEFKDKWKDVQINDWGSALINPKYAVGGHVSHVNGADNDYTILNVTSFELPGQKYDRAKAITLASLFLRAGAHTIYFDDPEVQEFFVKNRAREAKEHPEYKSKYKAWNDVPVTWAYSGGAAANHNHHNHFHVRWYNGPGNQYPPVVQTWLGSGADSLNASKKDDGATGSTCTADSTSSSGTRRSRAGSSSGSSSSGGDPCTYGPYSGADTP
jgi:hypothetical protein